MFLSVLQVIRFCYFFFCCLLLSDFFFTAWIITTISLPSSFESVQQNMYYHTSHCKSNVEWIIGNGNITFKFDWSCCFFLFAIVIRWKCNRLTVITMTFIDLKTKILTSKKPRFWRKKQNWVIAKEIVVRLINSTFNLDFNLDSLSAFSACKSLWISL